MLLNCSNVSFQFVEKRDFFICLELGGRAMVRVNAWVYVMLRCTCSCFGSYEFAHVSLAEEAHEKLMCILKSFAFMRVSSYRWDEDTYCKGVVWNSADSVLPFCRRP